jgi:choice-of-anchor B domain-containing protein
MRARTLIPMLLLAVCASTVEAQIAKPRAGFGRAVAFAGNELLVSEAANEATPGFVYVYAKSGGKWNETAALTAADGRPGDNFGWQVWPDGNRMIVAARNAAYIFERGARGWQQTAKLTPNVESAEAQTTRVAISGDVAVVGMFALNKNTGAAFVFRHNGNAWMQEARLDSPSPAEQNQFGNGVAVMGGDVVVGEVGADSARGGVHVFRKEGTEWKRYTKLLHTNAQKNDRFGAPIRLNGNRVLIGTSGFLNNSGAVFAYERQASGAFVEAERLLAFDGRAGEAFGTSFGEDGANLWVGAPGARQGRGKVYHMFRDAAGAWSMADPMTLPDLAQGDNYGAAVATSGMIAAIGLPNDDVLLGSVAVYEFDANSRRWNHSLLQRNSAAIATITSGRKDCVNGQAANFECSNVEMVSYVSADDLGAGRGMMINDIWGWTDPQTGKEWALVGRMDGTAFVDISNPEKPVVVGNLPLTKGANPNLWRDIKVYKNHAYVVADGAGQHGMQVFDLTRLRSITKFPTTFEPDTTYPLIASSHNIVINEETGFAYAVGVSGGGNTCGGGLHMIDIREPKKPTFAGCFSDPQTGRASTGYSHDAQCITYNGPDATYKGREICIGSNETMISIADVTDKKNPKAVARSSYPNVGYSHQGWISEDHRYFYMNDELDELAGTTPKTRTIVWDLTDLDDPQVAEMYLSPTSASDHNLYIKGDTMYQSHYKSGLRIVDISNRTKPVEVGYFDTVPYGENNPGFGGSWSNYPYFKSGNIIATSMNEGLFVLKKKPTPKPVL